MKLNQKIKIFINGETLLPDKIFINNEQYYYKEDYDGQKWICGYFKEKTVLPTTIKYFFIPQAEHENYKKARKILYNKLDAARAFYSGIDEALNNLA